MASEESSAAYEEDIKEDDDDEEDSTETNDPEDEVSDFIDEVEAMPTPEPIAVKTNPDYDPKCPGVDKKRCKKTGEDNTHLRKYTIKKRNHFMFKKHISNN